jgi:hypothetical protein
LIDRRGNRYSVPPELAATCVVVHQRLGARTHRHRHDSGIVLAPHQDCWSPGSGIDPQTAGHVTALEAIAFTGASRARTKKGIASCQGLVPAQAIAERAGFCCHHDRDQPTPSEQAKKNKQEHTPMNTPTTTTITAATPKEIYQQPAPPQPSWKLR